MTTAFCTPAVRRALEIVRDYGKPIRPREFARKMWPNSRGWKNVVKCGHGSHRGGGMYLAGGAYLAKLAKAKLVYRILFGEWNADHGYVLASPGREALNRSTETPT